MNYNYTLYRQVFEIVVDGVTVFGAFLIRDTLVDILNDAFPNRTVNVYINILYTLFTIFICVLFIYCCRRYIFKYDQQKNNINHQKIPNSFDLFD
jgi:hypothetical protein